MARIRSVKPEYWTSEQVMNMSRDARLLFIGLWTFCDDNGIHPASAISLKAEVFPGDDISADQVMSLVDEMIEQGLVEEYDVEDRRYWRVTGWRRHQRIDQPTYRHPTGDTEGDAGDTGDTKGDGVTRVTSQSYKRLGGKQRQIVLRKLRDRDGDACHLCGDAPNLSIHSLAPGGEENSNDINSLRLICPACKRSVKRGDTKKPAGDAGDTQGDTKVLDGDSSRESSRVESNGVERSGEDRKGEIQNPVIDSQLSPIAGDADGDAQCAGESLQPPLPQARNVQISLLLRAQNVQATAQHPIVCVTWANNPKVTDDVLNVAIARSKSAKPEEQIPVKYLARVVESLLEEQDAPPPELKSKKSDDWAWRKSNEGIDRKGREMGMNARGGESYHDFAARIQAAIDKRKAAPGGQGAYP
jgi:hypothetical protein